MSHCGPRPTWDLRAASASLRAAGLMLLFVAPHLLPAPAPCVLAADGVWSQTFPTVRYGCAVIHDPLRERMIIFGGSAGSGFRLNEVWALSLTGAPAWTKLTPSGSLPEPRSYASAIYDPVRDRMVVFGGLTEEGGRSFARLDVWALSLGAAPAWTQINAPGNIPRRFAHAAVYDPVGDRMIVFGGAFNSTTDLDDSWALSLSAAPAWIKLSPSGGPPEARAYHSAVYDPVRRRMVIFGGYQIGYIPDYEGYCNDAWALSLGGSTGAWTRFDPVGSPPPPRAFHSAVYDALRDRMVIFGGGTGSPSFDDTWSLSFQGVGTWSNLAPGNPPRRRRSHAAAYDAAHDRMVVFGGIGLNDTWVLPFGATSWTLVAPSDAPPGGRSSHSAIYDPVGKRMIIFGGANNFFAVNDAWSLNLGPIPTWSLFSLGGPAPSARTHHTAVYDPVRRRMVIFGGYDVAHRNDVWAALLAPRAWTQLTPAGAAPTPRANSAAIYDPVRDRMLVFGGWDGSHPLNDVWALSLGGSPEWTLLAPSGTPPVGRTGATAIYDAARDRLLVFGGNDGGYRNDVWALSLAGTPTWTPVAPVGTPPSARMDHTAVDDVARDRMLVFGGGNGYVQFNDAWALSLGAIPAWTLLASSGTPPSGRADHVAAYDPVFDRMAVFSGYPEFGTETSVLWWGQPALPDAGCPGDVSWTGAVAESIDYTIANASPLDRIYDYALRSSRDWPGFPITGSVMVPAGGAGSTATVRIGVPVPDTAAAGINVLAFRASLEYYPLIGDSCDHSLHDPTTPVALSLVSAEAEPDRVRLAWSAPGSVGLVATLYRREPEGVWERRAELAADGAGRLAYEDRNVRAGRRYGYRLGVSEGGVGGFYGEAWVTVPLGYALALHGVRPNPTGRELNVAFTLAGREPAWLELVDVSGRQLLEREVGSRGAGSHQVNLAPPAGLPSGIYLVRLVQGGRSLATRVCVLK